MAGLTCMAAAALLVCFSLAIHSSDGQCLAGNETYQEGEVWQGDDLECVEHTCLEDGTINSTKCETEVPTEQPQTTTDIPQNTEGTPVVSSREIPCAAGEVWEVVDGPDCIRYICLEDGVYNTTECNPESEVEHSTESQILFDYGLLGCTDGDRTVKVGDQVDLPGLCFYRACVGNNQWIMKACSSVGLVPGWILTPEDRSKSYPECCGRAVPLLEIIPDVIRQLLWSVTLEVAYDNVTVDYGNKLTPAEVKEQPVVRFKTDPADWYLLCMVDPDAPSRQDPVDREFLHWLVGNIPGDDVTAGEVLAEYIGAGPPKDTGLHRYVFVLFKQPGKLTFNETRLSELSADNRRKFSIYKFAQKYSLGNTISFNFFQSKWDDYVPTLHEQLGLKLD